MINNTIAEINEPSQTEVTSTDLLNLNFFNEFDMQILQIQSEVAYKVSTRQNRAKLLKHEIDADLDDEIKQLRPSIHDIRSASFLAGNVVDFNDKKTRRMYYGSRKFEFIDQVRLLKLSPTGKTCTFEAITLEKGFQSTYYIPLHKTKYTKTFERVRVSTLMNNFYEMK